jgi:hypothetical protein
MYVLDVLSDTLFVGGNRNNQSGPYSPSRLHFQYIEDKCCFDYIQLTRALTRQNSCLGTRTTLGLPKDLMT